MTMQSEILLSRRDKSFFHIVLLSVLGYEAAGAILGGLLLIVQPDGRLMDMPVDMLHGSFKDFLIPGIILLTLGLVTNGAFISVVRRSRTDWLMSAVALIGFAIWFTVEIVIIDEIHWLHLMWGLPVVLGMIALIPTLIKRFPGNVMQEVLIAAGIFSCLWYVAINLYVPTQYEGYSWSGLTVSELSAIGSPTRILWILLLWIYPVAFAAFGFGIIERSEGNRLLKIIGVLIIVYCIINLYWPPMHMRGEERTISDSLHIVWASATVLLMIAMMTLASIASKGLFRAYSIISILAHMVFGILTFSEAGNIDANGPTPAIGIWERINIAVFMLWVIIFAFTFFRRKNQSGLDQMSPLFRMKNNLA